MAPLLVSTHDFFHISRHSELGSVAVGEKHWSVRLSDYCAAATFSGLGCIKSVALQDSRPDSASLLRTCEASCGQRREVAPAQPGPASLPQTFKIILQSNFNSQQDHSRNWFLVKILSCFQSFPSPLSLKMKASYSFALWTEKC